MEDRRKRTRRERRIFNNKQSKPAETQPSSTPDKTQAPTPSTAPLTGSWAQPPSYTPKVTPSASEAPKKGLFATRKKPAKEENDDIGEIWAEQARIRDEEEALLQEYEQTKAKTKALKKKLKESDREGDKLNLKGVLTPELYETVSKKTAQTKTALRKTKTRVTPKVVAGVRKVGATGKKAGMKVKNRKVALSFAAMAALGVGTWAVFNLINRSDNGNKSGTQVEGLVDEKPSFEILYPSGKSGGSLRTVKVSPEGSAPSYAYIDELNGVRLQISQQQLPSSFKDDPQGELRKTATEFQATNVIQIDDTAVYTGINEKAGVQSLIFQKNGLLIFIRAEKQLPDDQWVGYIAGMK